MSDTDQRDVPAQADAIELHQILAEEPPGVAHGPLRLPDPSAAASAGHFSWPTIVLYCDGEDCGRRQNCRPSKTDSWCGTTSGMEHFVSYTCRNCGRALKTFALVISRVSSTHAKVAKVGEIPPFFPHVPGRVLTVMGKYRDIFLKGRKAEAQNMGIGAFAYYRQVVEHRKNELLDEILRVAEAAQSSSEVVDSIKKAKAETQFKKALEMVKVPESLLISGHNPMTLLHGAISDGLHSQTDEECLENAHAIRAVLVELVQRVDAAMKDNEELRASITKILNRQKRK